MNITALPTAATSYYTVRKSGSHFDVVLVTPSPFKDLKTRLVRFHDRETAIQYGKEAAKASERPFKLRGVAA